VRRKLHPESGAFITTAAAFVVFVLLPSTIRATGADQQELLRTEGKRFEGKVVLGDDPGIDEYLAYASHNSPALRSAYYRWSSRSEMIPSVSSLPDPVLTYTWFGESVETRVGPQRQRFGVRQPIPWFGTLGLRGDVTREEAWAAYGDYMTKRLQMAYQVRQAYSRYYLVGREIEIARSTLDLLRRWEETVRARYETGARGYGDLLRIQIETARTEDRLRALEDSRAAAAEQLRSAVGAPDTLGVPVPRTLPEPASIEGENPLAAVLENNPALLAADHMIRREEQSLSLAGRSSWPDLALGFEYIDTGEALDPSMPESGKDPWMVSLSVELPLWFAKHSAEKDAARARIEMSRYAKRAAEDELKARTERVLYELRDARSKVALYADTLIPRAEESLAVTLRDYEGAVADFLDVLEAQRLLLDLRLELEETLVRREIASAELEMLAGREYRPQ
jgi:outer membrane protein TolC